MKRGVRMRNYYKERVLCPECTEIVARCGLATHIRFKHRPNPPKVGRQRKPKGAE